MSSLNQPSLDEDSKSSKSKARRSSLLNAIAGGDIDLRGRKFSEGGKKRQDSGLTNAMYRESRTSVTSGASEPTSQPASQGGNASPHSRRQMLLAGSRFVASMSSLTKNQPSLDEDTTQDNKSSRSKARKSSLMDAIALGEFGRRKSSESSKKRQDSGLINAVYKSCSLDVSPTSSFCDPLTLDIESQTRNGMSSNESSKDNGSSSRRVMKIGQRERLRGSEGQKQRFSPAIVADMAVGLYRQLNFEEDEMEDDFRAEYWGRVAGPFRGGCLLGFLYCVVRLAMVHIYVLEGSSAFDACCTWFWTVDPDHPRLDLAALYFETLSSFLVVLGVGFSIERSPVMAWLSGRNWFVNLDACQQVALHGEILLVSSALVLANVSVSHYWYGSVAISCATYGQLTITLVIFPTLLQWQWRHLVLALGIALLVSVASTFATLGAMPEMGWDRLRNLLFCWMLLVVNATVIRRKEVGLREKFRAQVVEKEFREAFDTILQQMLPGQVIDRLIQDVQRMGRVEAFAEPYDQVSVLFIRINATESGLGAEDLVNELNAVYVYLDRLVEQHLNCYKVETVGGEYLVASGVPAPCDDHAECLGRLALAVLKTLDEFVWSSGAQLVVKMGIHSGALVAGVAGQAMPRFRLFGDTVNTASRMKSKAGEGMIVVSEETAREITRCSGNPPKEADGSYACGAMGTLVPLGPVPVKGKGDMHIWSLRPGTPKSLAGHLVLGKKSLRQKDSVSPAATAGGKWDSSVDQDHSGPGVNKRSRQRLKPKTPSVKTTLGVLASLHDGGSLAVGGPASGSFSATSSNKAKRHRAAMKSVQDGSHAVWKMIDLPPTVDLTMARYPPFSFYSEQAEFGFSLIKHENLHRSWKQLHCWAAIIYLGVLIGLIASALQDPGAMPREDFDQAISFSAGFVAAGGVSLALLVQLHRTMDQRSDEEHSGGVIGLILVFRFVFVVATAMAVLSPLLKHHSLLENGINMWSMVGWSPLPSFAFSVVSCVLLQTSPLLFLCANAIGTASFMVIVSLLDSHTPPSGMDGRVCLRYFGQGLYLAIIFSQILWLEYLQRLYFRSVAQAMKIRYFLEGLSRDLLPDHVLAVSLLKQEDGAIEGTEGFFSADDLEVGHLFADVAGFTKMCSSLPPEKAFIVISELFQEFDQLCHKWGVSKVETIGDAYWCASCLNKSRATQQDLANLVGMALEMQEVLRSDRVPAVAALGDRLTMRIGVHYGPCVGCVVGSSAPRYHLFGRAIDIVQQLEQGGSKHGVVLSSAALRVCLGLKARSGLEGAVAAWQRDGKFGDNAVLPSTYIEHYELAEARLQEIQGMCNDGEGGEGGSSTHGVLPLHIVMQSYEV